jgi:hypothetical protein
VERSYSAVLRPARARRSVRATRAAVLLACIAGLGGCDEEQPAGDPRTEAAVATVQPALRFDSEPEGRRVCRRVFTQAFMAEVSDLEDRQALLVCRLTRLSRRARGGIVDATGTAGRARVRIRYGGRIGTATVIRTRRGWQIDSATDGAVTALIGVKD